jgi:hypothetical protein
MNSENLLEIQRCSDQQFKMVTALKNGDFVFYKSLFGDGKYEPVKFLYWEKQNGIVCVMAEDFTGNSVWGYVQQFTLIKQNDANCKKLW